MYNIILLGTIKDSSKVINIRKLLVIPLVCMADQAFIFALIIERFDRHNFVGHSSVHNVRQNNVGKYNILI